ncbi:MAG: hypothetical protein D6808_00660 [Candidatus Dadabacteria bacterium]|nr:MAG: hypothetical protein D6808_00660 [Candidatus Dadabacteria bacterium]
MKPKSVTELFNEAMDAWIAGIESYPGEIYPELVYAVIREMRIDFYCAVSCNIAFDVLELADRIGLASKYLVPEKELVFNILAQLPAPQELKTEDQFYTIAQIVDKVEAVYPGALARLERRWQGKVGHNHAA